ncbi:nucleostemin 4 [Lycorma delicatula]|uniref:nucleostemin 4 n=1 Tax=Lycorma delicatula TaxID=130591 RepID=UPI003F50F995
MIKARRKVAFSGKAKREQLKAKKQGTSYVELVKEKKGGSVLIRGDSDDDYDEDVVQKIHAQPQNKGKQADSTKYALQFFQETKEEIEAKKALARQEIKKMPEEALEITIEDYFPPELDFPKRPPWDFNIGRDKLITKEQKYFREYVNNLKTTFDRKDLSLFELNLETWRQLWRVLEMSDIVLIIVDIRFPVLMFPPSLYRYVVGELKKDMILVLNKIDLAPAPLVVAWHDYFTKHFPSLHIVMFTSFPGYNVVGKMQDKSGLQHRKRKGRLRMAAEGAQKLLEACRDIVKDEVDLTSWQTKIKEEMELDPEDDDVIIGDKILNKHVDTGYEVHEKYKGGMLTIGCVGQPNVGKSSLMNAVMGKKVVSVSHTPGHTKHFQTIFLTPNVRLCDCPGLVFPSKVPRALQVIMGSYPVAQVREPFSVVMYVVERMDLVSLLRVQHPDGDDTWSAMDVCDGWAVKRGFKTARTGWLDSYRAANSLLRMIVDGKITLCLRPPGYSKQKKYWADHKDVPMVRWIQARLHNIECGGNYVEEHFETSEDEAKGTSGPSGDKNGVSDEDKNDKNDKNAEDDGNSIDDDDDDDDDDIDEDVDGEVSTSKSNRFSALTD